MLKKLTFNTILFYKSHKIININYVLKIQIGLFSLLIKNLSN